MSLAPTHVSWSVSKLVRHTFGFPISSRPSVQQSSLMTPSNASGVPTIPKEVDTITKEVNTLTKEVDTITKLFSKL